MKNKLLRGLVPAFALVAMLLVIGVSVDDSLAYFTTYVTAKGGYTISAGDSTAITEKFSDWKKTIEITNTGNVDCYVRVKIFAGEQFTITADGSDWSLAADGYWYYSKAVAPGQATGAITASIRYPAELEADFDVVVVQECTPVTYDTNGKAVGAQNADWSRAAVTGEGADS